MPTQSPYCSQRQLVVLRDDAGCHELEITDAMLLWTPSEAKAYFGSQGFTAPDPAVVSKRTAEDAVQIDMSAADQRRQETLLCMFCPCCDQIIVYYLDKRRAAEAPQGESMDREGDGSEPVKRRKGCACARVCMGCLCCSYCG